MKKVDRERRQYTRAKRILSIQFRAAKTARKGVKPKWHLSLTHDMSLGGLSFLTDEEYQAGDILELHVVMSGILDIFDGHAKVVRVTKKKTGSYFLVAVRFVDKKNTNKDKVILSKRKSVTRKLAKSSRL